MEDMQKNAGGEKQALKDSLSKMESKAKALAKELETRKREAAQNESVQIGLKNQGVPKSNQREFNQMI